MTTGMALFADAWTSARRVFLGVTSARCRHAVYNFHIHSIFVLDVPSVRGMSTCPAGEAGQRHCGERGTAAARSGPDLDLDVHGVVGFYKLATTNERKFRISILVSIIIIGYQASNCLYELRRRCIPPLSRQTNIADFRDI